MKELTTRQKLVLEFIHAYIKVKGYPPSYNNIAQGLGMKSRSNMHRVVHDLKKEGFLKLKPRVFRSVRVADKGMKKILAL